MSQVGSLIYTVPVGSRIHLHHTAHPRVAQQLVQRGPQDTPRRIFSFKPREIARDAIPRLPCEETTQ